VLVIMSYTETGVKKKEKQGRGGRETITGDSKKARGSGAGYGNLEKGKLGKDCVGG